MTNKQIKEDFISSLFDRPGIYTHKVNDTEYRTRCPFCGDSSSNENTGHFYLKINLNDNYPIQYHCFLCEAGGILQPSTLQLMDIDDSLMKSRLTTLCKTSDKIDKKGIVNEIQMIIKFLKLRLVKKQNMWKID